MKPWEEYQQQQPTAEGAKPWEEFAPQPKQPSGYGLTENPGIVEQFAGGAKHAWDRAASGMASLFGDKSLQPLVQQGAQFVKETGPASSIGQFAGDIALTAPIAAALPASLLPQIAGNAVWNAAISPEDRGTAAAVGGAGGAVGYGLSKAVKALTTTPEAEFLKSRGVPLTYGQMLGEPIQRVENTLAKVPYVGAPIRARQQEALEGWQALTRKQALPPSAPKFSAQTVDDVQKAFNDAYSSALSGKVVNLSSIRHNDVLEPVVKQFRGSVSTPQIQQAHDLVSRIMADLPKGPMTAQAAHDAEIVLKREAARLMKATDPATQEYGRFVGAVSDSFKGIWRGQLGSGEQQVLQGIDSAYSRYVPIRKASTVTDATLETPESYTPKMLLRAARQQDRTLGKSNYLTTPQGEVARAGKAVMENGPPAASTGTGIGSMVAGGLGHYLGADPVTLALVAGGGAGYGTKVGQQFMLGTLPIQRLLVDALRRATPAALRGQGGSE
jgi:hypothetical protein